MNKFKQPSTSNIEKYKTYLNCFNRIKRAAKEKYYHDIIEQNKQDIANTWKILKTIIGKQNDKSNLPQHFIIDNKQISDKVVIAEEFNKFFSQIGRCEDVILHFPKKLPLYDFPAIWNKWSSCLPINPTVIQTKKQMRASLLSQYADKVKCQNSRWSECKKVSP